MGVSANRGRFKTPLSRSTHGRIAANQGANAPRSPRSEIGSRTALVACVLFLGCGVLRAGELSWKAAAGTVVRYDVRIADNVQSASRKFRGMHTRDLTLSLHFAAPHQRESITPVVVGLEKYVSDQKDGDGFALQIDTSKAAKNDDSASMHAAAVEHCKHTYAAGINTNLKLHGYPDWFRDSENSRIMGEQLDGDLKLALRSLLIPVDGGEAKASRTWRVADEWDELREAVKLVTEYRVKSVSGQEGRSIAVVEFNGAGTQLQERPPAYTVKIQTKGEAGFDVEGHWLTRLESTESMTTDDAFNSARTRTITIKMAGVSQKPVPAAVAKTLQLPEQNLWILKERFSNDAAVPNVEK